MAHPLYAMLEGDDESAAAQPSGGSGGSCNSASNSLLQEVLAMCGVSSAPQRQPDSVAPFTLSHPPHRMRQILESELPRGSDRPARFVDELTAQCSTPQQLRRFLSQTAIPPPPPPPPGLPRTAVLPPSTRAASQQDSLIRVCLSVLPLQRPLSEWLLEQLAANEDEWLSADGIRASVLSQRGLAQSLPASSLPRLVLDQLRMLDVVYDSEALCSKLQEVTEALSTVKAELITALPDILIDPCYHDRMADCLVAQLKLSDALLLPVLDCLSRLHLTSRQKERIVDAVKPLMASAREKSLPALIRFLLQMTSDDSVRDILDSIRQHMPQLAEDHGSNGGGDKGGKEEREAEVSGAVLIMDALRSGLQQNQLACKAYMELLKADEKQFKAADVLVLFVVHSLPHNKQLSHRAVDALSKKLLDGTISASLLRSSIVSHVGCIRPMFDSVAALAEQLVRKQADRAVREAGGAMQVDLFVAFDDRAQRMTIVQSWLQQLGSREATEMDSALSCLQAVGHAKDGVRSLTVFFEYLKGVLQYLDDYKLSQIRTLFHILALLAFKKNAVLASERAIQHGAAAAADDSSDSGSGCHPFDTSLQVFVQKELYAPSLRDQHIGIVAVVALMQPIASYSPRGEQRPDMQHEQRGSLPDALCSLLDQLFGSLVKCTSRSPSAQSFLYDELSLALDSHRLLNLEVLHRIHKHFTSRYQPQFFIRRAHGEHPLPMTLDRQTTQLTCLDQMAGPELTANKSKWSFNITPTLLQPSPHRQLVTLPAELRLLAACYRADRPADDFVQLLIAPFALPAPVGRNQVERVEHFKQQTAHLQRVWISSLFHTIQALRELINAFSSPGLQLDSRDQENLAPCIAHRMQQLLKAEDELRAMLRATPDFTAQQLLSMADSTEERYMREMGALDGSMRADQQSSQYTVLSGKVHVTLKKKSSKATLRKRARADSSDDSPPTDTDDSEREEARRRKRRATKLKGKARKQPTVRVQARDESKSGPFDTVIRPLLRPLTIDAMQLICYPLSKNLIVAAEAAEALKRQEQAGRQHDEPQSEPEDNTLLLYKPLRQLASTDVPHLPIRVLLYLLTELRHKMEPVLDAAWSHSPVAPFFAKKASPSAVIPSSPSADTPVSLLAVLSPVLKGVHDHYLVLNGVLGVSDVDDGDDIDREELAACLIACVHIVRLIISCPTLVAPANRSKLRSAIVDLLGAVRQPAGGVAELSQIGEQSLSTLCQLLISRLRNTLGTFRSINDAVAVMAVIQETNTVSAQLSAEDEPSERRAIDSRRLHSSADKLLKRDWTTKVALRKQNVGQLVALLVRYAGDPHACMSSITPHMSTLAVLKPSKKNQTGSDEDDEVQDERTDRDKRPYVHSLTKQTVPLWLSPMIDYTSRLLSTAELGRLTSTGAGLERIQLLVQLAAELLNIAKLYPRHLALHKQCIRVALRMIDSFTRSLDGMGALLDGRRQRNEGAVKQTLSGMQRVTRAFNALCMHVKDQQAASLLAMLPKAKMAYEKWLMAVKRLCKQHSMDFTAGQLRNRALDGHELMTQLSPQQPDGASDREAEAERPQRAASSSKRAAKRRRRTKEITRSDSERSVATSGSSSEDQARRSASESDDD